MNKNALISPGRNPPLAPRGLWQPPQKMWIDPTPKIFKIHRQIWELGGMLKEWQIKISFSESRGIV